MGDWCRRRGVGTVVIIILSNAGRFVIGGNLKRHVHEAPYCRSGDGYSHVVASGYGDTGGDSFRHSDCPQDRDAYEDADLYAHRYTWCHWNGYSDSDAFCDRDCNRYGHADGHAYAFDPDIHAYSRCYCYGCTDTATANAAATHTAAAHTTAADAATTDATTADATTADTTAGDGATATYYRPLDCDSSPFGSSPLSPNQSGYFCRSCTLRMASPPGSWHNPPDVAHARCSRMVAGLPVGTRQR